MRKNAGRPLGAALSILLTAGAAAGGSLSVEDAQGALLTFPVRSGAEWCLHWNHSVTGGPVTDCFINDGGQMKLTRSYLHDFAAGLGEVAGRGRLRPADGRGYWIEGIDESIPGNVLVLRVGRAAVDHRLRIGGKEHSLSAIAAGERVELRLEP